MSDQQQDAGTPERDRDLERAATLAGAEAGYAHAVYVDAYGGDLAAPSDVPGQFESAATFYTAGWGQGVQRLADERDDEHEADQLEDPAHALRVVRAIVADDPKISVVTSVQIDDGPEIHVVHLCIAYGGHYWVCGTCEAQGHAEGVVRGATTVETTQAAQSWHDEL